ncbi:enoyl-CoA hydratase/isomerase family protein [Rhizorhabdus wittichii]|uniref:enoyl-CoA hydratase/isomerase family protein n=1 Tax=Rhizorhabdus wittichii TaxID=160791 RepID=UPI0002F0B0D9|nr:enoyl-CoA hydratase/isomerase family protein [Rhizorhabdus wittichii]
MGVIIRSEDRIVQIQLDWPEVRNAMGPSEARVLTDALSEAVATNGVAAIVISANGVAFCAGGNLREILALAEQGAEAVRSSVYGVFQGLFRTIADCPVPLIAAVDGPAVGFGCDLALAADLTFVGPQGWLAQGWAQAGLIPATGGTFYAKRRGGQLGLWSLLSRARLNAAEAQAAGLAMAVDNALEAAMAAGRTLAGLPAEQVRATKALSRIDTLEEHLEQALQYQVGFITSPSFMTRARKILSRT